MWRGQGRAEAGRVAASNQLHFRSVHSCLDFDAVFQHGFREGYSGIPKLQTRLSIFMKSLTAAPVFPWNRLFTTMEKLWGEGKVTKW